MEDVARTAEPSKKSSSLRFLGLAAVAGIILLVGGCAAGMVSYDQRFIEDYSESIGRDDPKPFWEAVAAVGLLAVLAGVLGIVISVIGVVIVGIARILRRMGSR
jgi:hypothetical protein